MGSRWGSSDGHRGRRVSKGYAAVLALAVAAGAATACTSGSATTAPTGKATAGTQPGAGAATPVSTSGPAVALQEQYQSVVRAVLPSVVQISTSDSTGSGVVYDGNGDIVTNAHVVGTAHTVQVQSSTGDSMLQAKVIGAFTPDDLAVIRVTAGAGSLHPAHFGASSGVEAGQIVLAMGSPLGLTGTVTEGIISATGRTVTESSTAGGTPTTIANALQTSAAINSGNSGGALVNLAGQVIGIPSAAAQNPGTGNQASGIGFAIPSDTVTNIAGQLIATGKVTSSNRAALGIQARDAVTASGDPGGIAITSVTPGGPAASAGLRAGDVIIEINGAQIPSLAALSAELANLKPGEKVTVKYLRDSSVDGTEVTLGSLKSQ